MVLKSYAKINLSLSVNKKLKSGFHDIQSIYCLIDLNDKILVKKIKNNHSDVISFSGPFSKHVNKSDNSIQKILSLMRTNKLIKGYYSIKVQKKIPVFGGFGWRSARLGRVGQPSQRRGLRLFVSSRPSG